MPKARRVASLSIFYFLTVYLIFFLLKNSELARAEVLKGVRLCAKSVIPSLFPFMILCSVTLNSGLGEALGKLFGRPFSLLFGIPNDGSAVFILGCLFGFPLGTSNAAALYKKNLISKDDAERLICFCSNTGPAFITGVAAPALGSMRTAWFIYISQILAAVIIGIFCRKQNTIQTFQKEAGVSISPNLFIKAVTECVVPMLNICGFVTFFSCISCSVEAILHRLNASPTVSLFAKGFLEITNGFSAVGNFGQSIYTALLCAFFVGWSGLSVILQGCSIAKGFGLSCKRFVISKLLQGCLTSTFCLLFCKFFDIY